MAVIAEPGLRERTRRAVQAEVAAVAMDLFARNGFEHTTVDQIVAAAGMSPRSFFRYFASKEDVVLGAEEAIGQWVADALAARPKTESPWQAARRAFDLLVERNDADEQRNLILRRMLADAPSLRAGHLKKQSRWQELLAPHLANHLPPPPRGRRLDPRPLAIAAAALACLNTAQDAWVREDGRVPFGQLLDESMTAVGPL
ncbi:MAG: transcriptional regulator, TetR family [Frankiales bacterium]|jgi:AcrR family transcriptional regulator|nr:transcriptional regulator, TetR family [Frankiales bacterium]